MLLAALAYLPDSWLGMSKALPQHGLACKLLKGFGGTDGHVLQWRAVIQGPRSVRSQWLGGSSGAVAASCRHP